MKPEPVIHSLPKNIYRTLTERLSGVTGQEFLDAAVRVLAFSLDAEYAFITRLDAADPEHLQVIAAWQVNRPAARNMRLTLAGTPAEDTLNKRQLWYEDNVSIYYPSDHWLRKHGIRAYCAVAIPGAGDAVFGHLGVMCRQALQADDELLAALHAVARRAGAELQRLGETQNPRYREFFDNAAEGLYLAAADGRLIEANPALAELLGYVSVTELLAAGINIDSILYLGRNQRRELQRKLELDGAYSEQECRVFRRDRSTVWVRAYARVLKNSNGQLVHYEGILRDDSARKRAEQDLLRTAYHDPLTGIPNRSFFLERLHRMLQPENKRGDHKFAVLFLDIDSFKLINDSLGHSFGDRVLVAITKRLATCVRPADVLARYGGDEFAILLERVQGLDEATAVADRIHEELGRAFNVDGRDVFSTASIGILADSLNHYEQPDELLRDADTAMYRAKAAGKAGYVVFDELMHSQVEAKLRLETELRHALQRNEFRVYFQPIVELSTGRLTGFESLVRWAHPTRGLLAPEHFLPVAEETGLIMPLGWWVMETACIHLAQWRKRYRFLRDGVTVSVNIANRQFAHWVLPQRVARMLETVGLPPSSLCLEITETVFMSNPDIAIETITRLRAIGVNLQMDDFGTGYSSLSALRTFKLDTLKIDRSFVSGITQNRSDRAIVRTVTVLAADLGMDVVAEGIENAEQLELLRALGCHRGQGFYFAEPMSAGETRRYLKARAPATKR